MKKIVSFLLAMVIMLGSVPINAFAGDVTVAPDVTVQEQNTTPAEGEKTLTEGTQPQTEGTQPQTEGTQPKTEGAQPLTEGAQPLTDPNADPAALAATTATKILIPINETATVSYRNGVSYQLEPSGIVTLEPIQNGKSLKIRPIERGSAVLTVTTKTKTLTYNIEVAPITTGFFVVTPTEKSLGTATPEITTNVPYTKVGVGNLNIWDDGIKHVGNHYGLIDYTDKFINNNYIEEPETIQGTFEYKGKTYNYADCTISWYKIVDEGKDGNIEIHVDGYITALPTVVNPPVVTGKEVDVNVWYWNNADEANSLVAANTPPVPQVTTGEALKYQYGEDILNNNNLDLLIAACEEDFYAKKNVRGLTYIRTEIVEIIGEGANSQVVILYTTDSNDTECEHLYNSIGETVIKDVENLQRVEIRVVFNDDNICNVKFEQPKYIADEDKDTTAAINALTENFVATNGKIAEGTKLLKILPTFETIDGYTFDGWGIKDADGNETKMTDDAMPAGGITLVPYFTKNVVIEPKDIKVYYFIYQNPSSTMNDFTPVKQVNKNEKLIYEYNGETLTDSRLEQLAADYLAKLAETNDVEGISYLYADIYQLGANNIYEPVHTNENLNRGRTVYTTRTTGVQNNNNNLSDLSEVKVTAETEIRLMFSGTVKNKEYAVTFKTLDENNETVNNVTNMPTIEKILEDAKIEELLSTPKADGYEFKGWFIGTRKVNSTTVMPNKDIELTAKFAKKPQAQVSFKAVDENGKELQATN
ncbi:MAG: InlB B-repeat-containing protein, partial [Oscillospiraceae bacterium]